MSIIDKYRYLEVSALACNAKVMKIVENEFAKHYPEVGDFFLYEYF